MVLVPGGWFLMGTNELDADERPPHRVWIDPFFLDRHEVTAAEFARFARASGYRARGNWRTFRGGGDPNLPVAGVTWEDAAAYCRWAGKRLPREAEWERAARGPEGRSYPYGSRYDRSAANADSLGSRPVGSYPPNGFGLFDLSGNVAEWCADWYAAGFYSVSPARNPRGPAAGDFRVVRGGSWANRDFLPQPSRCDARSFATPHTRSGSLGFRAALSLRTQAPR
jgi:formylglycine-generating enzyme required for sulfatase activity